MKAVVLFVSANPAGTGKLDLDEEYRAIDHEKTTALRRDDFHLVPVLAATIDDLRRKLAEHGPSVVHFGGHGVAAAGTSGGGRDLVPEGTPASAAPAVRGELALKGHDGEAAPVPAGALAGLFQLHRSSVRCVVLNCCHSLAQAELVAKHVDCAIGTQRTVSDGAAIAFAKGFYRTLCDGGTLADSFAAGRNAVGLDARYEHEEDVFVPCWREPGKSENVQLVPHNAPAAGADDWKYLCEISSEHAAGWAAAAGPGLRMRDWREVQPALASVLDAAHGPRIALTGRGGVGKTTTLKDLFQHADPRCVPIFLTGENLRGIGLPRLREAFERGRAEATAAGKCLALFIDAFEGFAERREDLRDCLAALGHVTAKGVATVVLTVRATVWSHIAPSPGGAGAFSRVELADWLEDIVRAEVKASERSSIGDDLIQLLRTPLLLDLFLRTFGTSQEIPEGLQSRHGILSAYWNRRVLDGDPVARSAVLHRFAEEEAKGVVLHREHGLEAQDLCSEGVIVVRQAAYVFRHALLRDFALMRWTFDADSPDSMVSRLSSVRFSLTRFGAIRAVLEAACDRAPDTAVVSASGSTIGAGDLIAALASSPGALFMAADVLGELDDPSPVDLAPILARLPDAGQASAFVERVVDAARTSLNRRWLAQLAALPEATSWAEATPWVSAGLVCKIAQLLEVVWRDQAGSQRISAIETTARVVARRVRDWSQAPRLQPALLENDAWSLAHRLMQAVAEVEPTEATFRWLGLYAMQSWRTRTVVVSLLPKIVARAGAVVEEADIEALYLRTGGLRWEGGTIAREPRSDPMWEHDWIRWPLLGADNKGPGLLSLLPTRFLPIAFGLLAVREDEREHRWAAPSAELRAAFDSWFAEIEASRTPEQRAAEASLQASVLPQLRDEEATGDLVLDASALVEPAHDSEVGGGIVSGLRSLLESRLKGEETWVTEVYWPAARASRSVVARALLLDVLAQPGVRLPAVVDELLADHRLYHVADVHYYLATAISARWRDLDQKARAGILHNIEEVARSPRLDGRYAVGPLLSAVPEEDRSPHLRPYIDIDTKQGPDPRPAPPSRLRRRATARSIGRDELLQLVAHVDALPPGCVEPWKRVFGWRFGEGAGRSEALAQAVQDLRLLLDGCLPEGEVLAGNAWTLRSVGEFLQALEQARSEGQPALTADRDVGEPDLRAIIAWGFKALESFGADEVNADRRPVEPASADAQDSAVWSGALQILDAALAHPAVVGDLDLKRRLLDWMAKVIADPSPRAALQLLRNVRPYHWLSDADRGARLLRALLGQQLADAEALRLATPVVFSLSRPLRDKILAAWLTEARAVSVRGTVRFPEEVGVHLADLAFRGDAPSQTLIKHLLLGQPDDGILSDVTWYLHFIKGIVFGAKEVVVHGGVGPERATDYAGLIAACWDALQRSGAYEEHADEIKLALLAFHPIASSRPRRTAVEGSLGPRSWWSAMAPLARRIVVAGARVDVFDLVFSLREKAVVEELGASQLRDLVEAIDARVRSESGEALRERSGRGNDWPEILGYASELLENVALSSDPTSELRDRIFEILQQWGGPPLRVERAVTASRNVRR